MNYGTPRDFVCVFCGAAFQARSPGAMYCSRRCRDHRSHSGCATLDEYNRLMAVKKAARSAGRKAASKKVQSIAPGLTAEKMRAVELAQDGDPAKLWELSQSWTPAQRKYARKRYERKHQLFGIVNYY